MDPNSLKTMTAAAGAGGGDAVKNVEDLFSTRFYMGTGSTQSVTNGVDLSDGGLVWFKGYDAGYAHHLYDSGRGVTKQLGTEEENGEATKAGGLTSFNADGFTIGNEGVINGNLSRVITWSFKKEPGFFDIVTYTGNGGTQNISHSLGCAPGMIIVKRTDANSNWCVWHKELSNTTTKYIELNNTGQEQSGNEHWNSTAPTSSQFSIGDQSVVNANGGTYVAYLFADGSDAAAQIFGSGEDQDVVRVGAYTGTSFGNYSDISDLTWEPQWLLVKAKNQTTNWAIIDCQRGMNINDWSHLRANTNDENSFSTSAGMVPQPDGMHAPWGDASTNAGTGYSYIYLAIRRPMKTPSAATEVFSAVSYEGTGSVQTVTTNIDNAAGSMIWIRNYDEASRNWCVLDQLRGFKKSLFLNTTAANSTDDPEIIDQNDTAKTTFYNHTGFDVKTNSQSNSSGNSHMAYSFKRAPGFFDIVTYKGNATAGRNIKHGLGVVPEMMIVRAASITEDWMVYHSGIGNTVALEMNTNNVPQFSNAAYIAWNHTTPTASVFTVGSHDRVNDGSSADYIAYLFATLAGVSKVGSYTGNGSTQDIDCGFSAGARFVLIKRTDGGNNWFLFDSTRGINSGNDPRLVVNGDAAQVTTTDFIDPLNAGFTLATSDNDVNGDTDEYVYLAIA